jgi:hypothetical protein
VATSTTAHTSHAPTEAVLRTAVERGSSHEASTGPTVKGSTTQARRTSQGRTEGLRTGRDLRTRAVVANAWAMQGPAVKQLAATTGATSRGARAATPRATRTTGRLHRVVT